MATAVDNCGDVFVELTFEEIPGDVEGAYTLNLIYTATDEAGNSISEVVSVEVGDTVPDGDCDCDGNQLDAIGVCGGDCLVDSDGDGIVICLKSSDVQMKSPATTTLRQPKTTAHVPTLRSGTTVTANVWRTSTETASVTILKCQDVQILPTPATTPTRQWRTAAVWSEDV